MDLFRKIAVNMGIILYNNVPGHKKNEAQSNLLRKG
jgi:hypothetical protein